MLWEQFHLPPETIDLLSHSPEVKMASTTQELIELSFDGPDRNYFEVCYEIPGRGTFTEAVVARVRNGIVANYSEPYMRRRDPDCLVVGDADPTNKDTFEQRYGMPFEGLRQDTLNWLKTQKLAVFAFTAGRPGMGMNAMAVVPPLSA